MTICVKPIVFRHTVAENQILYKKNKRDIGILCYGGIFVLSIPYLCLHFEIYDCHKFMFLSGVSVYKCAIIHMLAYGPVLLNPFVLTRVTNTDYV